jgi:hypothetical protein
VDDLQLHDAAQPAQDDADHRGAQGSWCCRHRPRWTRPAARLRLEKRFWIYTKLAEKDRLQRQVPRKEFVGGEGFLYLGRSHRLKLVDEQDVPLKLAGWPLLLRRTLARRAGAFHPLVQRAGQASGCGTRWQDYQARMEVQPGRREGAGPGLPLGLMRQGRLAVLPLEGHPAAAAHCRVRGGA